MDTRNRPLPESGRGANTLAESYRLVPGVPDEMMDANGDIRPAWRPLLDSLASLDTDEIAERFEQADQYLRDAGVFYRNYDALEGNERAWPLSHLPLIIEESEWTGIARGLTQRAELLEKIVADIYGSNQLVQRGLLPPELVARNPEFLRPLVGVQPSTEHFLHFCAFELGRAPDGGWWVLGDRTQAPSGAGFALENRVATTRALSEISSKLHVHRLAGFFRDFRDALNAVARVNEGSVAILTPGQLNETYFEHAYIARYLGFMLLEGEDLVVDNSQVMVRTIEGLKPISVLWRRMDAAFADPLELRTDSRIGTPGLIDAVRQGSISIVNALGSGILETRALSAFMPNLCKALLGEGLELPSIATWWCGQPSERQHVADNLDKMLVGPAFATNLAIDDADNTVSGGRLDPEAREKLLAQLNAEGSNFVGQESVQLSTAPVYVEGRLEARPITLRVYAARGRDGWSIMPGGFARVGLTSDTTAIAMQRGGQAADVWVVSPRPVENVTLLPREDDPVMRVSVRSLPSRAADNLIWLGRYAERCESIVRVLRAYHVRLAEASSVDHPLLKDTRDYLEELDIDAAAALPQGLLSAIDSAVNSAGQIRDRFSPDGWLALADLRKTAQAFASRVQPGDDAVRALTVLLRKLAGFSGLVHENMYRFAGWRFLEIGRRLERGIQMAGYVSWFTRKDAPEGAVDMLLEIGDSVMAHRRRYAHSTNLGTYVDLLVLDPLNPRSVRFQIAELREQIERLPGGTEDGHLSPAAKTALMLHTELRVTEPEQMTTERLGLLAVDIGNLATQIADANFV